MKKTHYIDIMEKVLSAYTGEHIDRYYQDVKEKGLTEHGFPRLTANIGILIAHGRRTDLLSRFIQMMNLCCEEIPQVKDAANEFSIKEIIFCILELEKCSVVSTEQINAWKECLAKVTVQNCYSIYAEAPDSKVNNWAAFTMLSEWMRYYINAAEEDRVFIDNQAASQLQFLDNNGMYREPDEPMVYDLVTRGLFSLLFHFGYRGKYFEQWDQGLKKAGMYSLKMLSVTGEIPYGGRSNQFLHNEAHAAVIMEYEAARYEKLGDLKTAEKFKAAAGRALENIELWLKQNPITHVKNAFPRDIGYGCEIYAYFDKYMITAASFLYVAYLFCKDTVPAGDLDDVKGESWQTSDHFHKVFLRAGEYFAEYDYCADYHYDASGLGRLHRKNAPSALCLSTPGTHNPCYKVNTGDEMLPFAISPQVLYQGEWLNGAAPDAIHQVEQHGAKEETAFTRIRCSWQGKTEISGTYLLDKDGMKITLDGKGSIGLMIPAFQFDGQEKTVMVHRDHSLSVQYKNWVCRYQVENGKICRCRQQSCNRNGHYEIFRAEGENALTIRIAIYPVNSL